MPDTNRNPILFLMAFFLSLFAHLSINAQTITGMVIEKGTQTPLPYASVFLSNGYSGTITNDKGEFSLNLTDIELSDSIHISFVGFTPTIVALSEIDIRNVLRIELESNQELLREVIIHPKSPTDYIKEALDSIPNNYSDQPYSTLAYYNEQITEDQRFIKHLEAVFLSHHQNFVDSPSNHNQVVLYREKESLDKLKFMRSKAEKEWKKHAEKNDIEAKSMDEDMQSMSFSGPSYALMIGKPASNFEPFLQPSSFKHFNYVFNDKSTDDILVIDFKSKKAIDYLLMSGSIVIDKISMAFIEVKCEGEISIPALVQPIVYLMGWKVNSTYIDATKHYKKINGLWYLNDMQLQFDVDITKRKLWSKNERAFFHTKQVFSVSSFNFSTPQTVPKHKRFNPQKKFSSQVYPLGNLDWKDINTLR